MFAFLWFGWQHYRPPFAPVNRWFIAHITAYYLTSVFIKLDQHGWLAVLVSDLADVLGEDFIFIISFNIPEQLLLSLNFEHHLAVDVLNVEIFSCNHQCSSIAIDVVIERMISVAAVGQRQRVVPSGSLLEGVDRLWGWLGTTVLGGLLHFSCWWSIVGVLDVHVLRGAFLSRGLERLGDVLLHVSWCVWTHVNIKVLNLVWTSISKVIFLHCSHHWLLAHASLNAVGLLRIFSWMRKAAISHRPICWHVVPVQALLIFRLPSSRGSFNSVDLSATSATLAILLKHLLLLCCHLAPIVLLKDIVLDIRILLHLWWLSKLRALLVELVGRNTSRALGLDLHLAGLWLAWGHLFLLLLDGCAALVSTFSAAWSILLVLCWIVRVVGNGRWSCLLFTLWLVSLTQDLGVVLIFVKLFLVLAWWLVLLALRATFV